MKIVTSVTLKTKLKLKSKLLKVPCPEVLVDIKKVDRFRFLAIDLRYLINNFSLVRA